MKKISTPSIVFEDPNVIVLSKPAGLLSQGAEKGDANVVDWLRDYLGRHYVGLIHRLDRNVSGLMVVAKRTKAASRLTKALQERKVERLYQGWVSGLLNEKERWEHWLFKDTQHNEVRVVSKDHAGAQKAALSVTPLAYGAWKRHGVTLVEYQLETGRSHQIRVQSSAKGHAILGDPKYGDNSTKGFGRPALHAYKLSFPHPISGEVMTFSDPLPEDMQKIKQEPSANRR